jgi:hypothetical protein
MSDNFSDLNPSDDNIRHHGCSKEVFALLEAKKGKNNCFKCQSPCMYYTCVNCYNIQTLSSKPALHTQDINSGCCNRCHTHGQLINSICLPCVGISIESIRMVKQTAAPSLSQSEASDDLDHLFTSRTRSLFSTLKKKKRKLPHIPAPAG